MCTRDWSADTDCTLFNPASVCENGKCTDSNDSINTIPPLTTLALPTTCVIDLDCYGIAQVYLFAILVRACASVRPMSFDTLG